MAKTRNKKGLSKQLQVAIVLGVVLAVMMYGGQITGMGTGGVANMTISISGQTSCDVTTALHTVTTITGGTATTQPSDGADAKITNDGNVDLLITINASTSVNGLFTDAGSTVNVDAACAGCSSADTATLGTSLHELCDLVETAEYCTFHFDTTITASEPAATGGSAHVFEYDIICSAT